MSEFDLSQNPSTRAKHRHPPARMAHPFRIRRVRRRNPAPLTLSAQLRQVLSIRHLKRRRLHSSSRLVADYLRTDGAADERRHEPAQEQVGRGYHRGYVVGAHCLFLFLLLCGWSWSGLGFEFELEG